MSDAIACYLEKNTIIIDVVDFLRAREQENGQHLFVASIRQVITGTAFCLPDDVIMNVDIPQHG